MVSSGTEAFFLWNSNFWSNNHFNNKNLVFLIKDRLEDAFCNRINIICLSNNQQLLDADEDDMNNCENRGRWLTSVDNTVQDFSYNVKSECNYIVRLSYSFKLKYFQPRNRLTFVRLKQMFLRLVRPFSQKLAVKLQWRLPKSWFIHRKKIHPVGELC